MDTKIKNKIIKETIKRVISNSEKSHRLLIQEMIDKEFLNFCIKFFKQIVSLKLDNETIGVDWYKDHFINESLDKNDIATNAGLNVKTITNTYNTSKKATVIEASLDHYDNFCKTIENLIKTGENLEVELTIKFNKVSVDLNISESLIVINALAVKRSAFLGGINSTIGKTAEKPLMITLCKLYDVPSENYSKTGSLFEREIDFYLISPDGSEHKTEVKLMGKGNPESADVIHARSTEIFVADKLSDLNKNQLDENNVKWVCLNDKEGYKNFENILNYYDIPHTNLRGDLNVQLDNILNELFSN